MIRDFLRLLARMLKYRGGHTLVGRLLLLQTYDMPTRKAEEERKKRYYQRSGRLPYLLYYMRERQSEKSSSIVTEEAHALHLEYGSDSLDDIETVISQDLQSERESDFQFVYMDQSIIVDDV